MASRQLDSDVTRPRPSDASGGASDVADTPASAKGSEATPELAVDPPKKKKRTRKKVSTSSAKKAKGPVRPKPGLPPKFVPELEQPAPQVTNSREALMAARSIASSPDSVPATAAPQEASRKEEPMEAEVVIECDDSVFESPPRRRLAEQSVPCSVQVARLPGIGRGVPRPPSPKHALGIGRGTTRTVTPLQLPGLGRGASRTITPMWSESKGLSVSVPPTPKVGRTPTATVSRRPPSPQAQLTLPTLQLEGWKGQPGGSTTLTASSRTSSAVPEEGPRREAWPRVTIDRGSNERRVSEVPVNWAQLGQLPGTVPPNPPPGPVAGPPLFGSEPTAGLDIGQVAAAPVRATGTSDPESDRWDQYSRASSPAPSTRSLESVESDSRDEPLSWQQVVDFYAVCTICAVLYCC